MTKSINLILVVCASTMLLSGCLSSSTSLSTMRMDRPEVSANKYALTTKVGLGGRKTVKLTTPYGSGKKTPPTISNSFDGNVDISPAVSLGITPLPRLEVSISSLDDAKISVKYQFSGDSADKAKQGNFSQAVSVGFSRYNESTSISNSYDSTDYSVEPPVTEYRTVSNSFEHDTYAVDAAWILGYRLTNNMLVYGGPFYINGNLSGEHTFTSARADNAQMNNQTVEETLLNLDSSGSMLGANVALEYKFDFGLFLTAEVSFNRMEWEDASDSSANGAVIIGYQF